MNNENWYKLLQQLDVSIDKNKYSRTKDKISLSAKHGFLMHAIPKQVGGYGNKFIDLYNAHRVLGYETQDTSLILSLNAHIWGTLFPILMFGNEQQKDTFFKDLLTGKAIGGHAITEPTAGSDSASILSTAVPTQKGYILNGHKKYITNSPISDLIIVYAKIEKALSAFIVLKEDIGIKFSSTCNVSCFPESPIGEIILENCLIPNDRLLGRIGIGTTIIQKALELERSFLFAGILGVMQWQLEQVISYSRSRVINKKLLRDYKNISHKIAEISL
jgi:alkylation response protein AidB-like acyl-CoA dehydrogenase